MKHLEYSQGSGLVVAVKLKDFSKQLEKSLRSAEKELSSRSNMTKLGRSLADDIVKRTRLGYGVRENGGRRERLAPLSNSYVEQRRGKLGFFSKDGKTIPVKPDTASSKTYLQQTRPKLAGTTSPKKSNLTQTGRMLRSIGVLFSSPGRVIIGFNTNLRARIAAFVSKKRPFFFATNNEEKRLIRKTQKLMTELIQKYIRQNL